MYIKFEDKKITVVSEIHDSNMLTLTMTSEEYNMQEIYDMFKAADLSSVIIYNGDDDLFSVHTGYTTIDTFLFSPSNEQYIITLSKVDVEDVQESLEQISQKVDRVSANVEIIKNGDLTKQSEYALGVMVTSFTDEQALNCVLLFEEWDPNGKAYKKDDRLRYGDELYKVLQDHVSQADWTPDTAVSLYVKVADPAIEWPEWVQPTGAHDAYMKDDKVTRNGKHYISLIDNNTWDPETYPDGWKLVEDEPTDVTE